MQEYIVSARKYRPMTFDTVVGQSSLTTTLKNAIATDKLAHAYLFCGPRGVGKTTCARIFAKTINCLSPKENGESCGECESCRAFDEGRSMNIHELDAASNNGVDDIRELNTQVQIPPQIGKYKVFIIDEVHMLTTAAFNAFLKTLEEPPSYVIFILATTEKHKILPTILSRCQVYDFSRMSVENTIAHLRNVAQQEGYTTEDEALQLIAEKADGGMRDALSIFDQMVSFTSGNLTYEKVCASLNVLSTEYYFKLVDYFLSQDVPSCMLLFNEVLNKGFEGGNFIAGLASHMRQLLVAKDTATLPLLEVSERTRERYCEQAKKCDTKFIYRAIKLCNECDQSYRQSHNKRLQVEICLIQCAQINEEDTPGSGRCPDKILKPIFQKLTASPRADGSGAANATIQHAHDSIPTQPVHLVQTPQSATIKTIQATTSPVDTPQEKTTAAQLKKVKMKSFPGQKNNNVEVLPKTEIVREKKATPLQEDRVVVCWFEYIGKMSKTERAMSMRMRDMKLEIIDANTFKVTVNNIQVAQEVKRLLPEIESHFRERIENDNVQIAIEVAEAKKVERIYSKQERYRMMLERNTALRKLSTQLDLRLN